jgi:hypothetical protein
VAEAEGARITVAVMQARGLTTATSGAVTTWTTASLAVEPGFEATKSSIASFDRLWYLIKAELFNNDRTNRTLPFLKMNL